MNTAADHHRKRSLHFNSCSLQVISYKWLARKFGLPCNLAKQTLFAFLEQHRGKVKATYLLAGWTKTDPRQHTVQLVDSEHLSTRRSALDPVTSMHVYSLQPTQPKVSPNFSSLLWQTHHNTMCAAETVDLRQLPCTEFKISITLACLLGAVCLQDASELWNHDAIQTSELFQELRLGQTNCLADNRHGTHNLDIKRSAIMHK